MPRSGRAGHWSGSAAEADLVAVGVAVDHLAHTVPVGLLRGGLDSPGAEALDPLIELADEHRVQRMAGVLGQLLDIEVPVLGKLPHRLRSVREERGFTAQQPLIPRERALIVAHRKPREKVNHHAFTLTPRPRGQYAESRCLRPKGCVNHARECPQRTGGGWHFTRRKGVKAGQGKATLTLVLPAPLITQLRAHRLQQTAERLAAGSAWQDWDLVFCTPIGSPINSHDDWEDWHALLAEASVRTARVHDARHTAATLLLEQGIDIRVVQQILGHSQLSQTQRYTHVTAELSRHAADRMSEALWG
jgi:integrase-like protein